VKVYYVASTLIDITKLEFFVLVVLSSWMIIMGLYDALSII
jgi:hypothetical protein